MKHPTSLEFTDDPAANRLLAANPLALLIGMLLDQQITMEKAFRGPYDLQERLGVPLDAATLAAMPLETVQAAFGQRPALHRFPKSMAERTHALCAYISEHHDGSPQTIWEQAADAADLVKRLQQLPGFGEEKSRIFVGVLGKRLGVRPHGWTETAADWASIADVARTEDIETIRVEKRARRKGRR